MYTQCVYVLCVCVCKRERDLDHNMKLLEISVATC